MDGRPGSVFAIVTLCLSIVGCTTLGPTADLSAPSSELGTATDASPTSPYSGLPSQAVATDAPSSPYLAANSAAVSQSEAAPRAVDAVPSNGATNAPTERKTSSRSSVAGASPSLETVAAELQSLEGVDPTVKRQLLADLQQTDPSLWPMMLQTFRAGMKYRERTEKPQAAVAESTAARRSNTSSGAEWKSPTNESEVATSIAANKPSLKPAAPAILPTAEQSTARFVPNVDALGSSLNLRGSTTPGLAFPAASLLTAALSEAQRRDETSAAPPSEGDDAPATNDTADDPAATEEPLPVRPASFEQPLAKSPTVVRKSSPDRARNVEQEKSDDWNAAVAGAIASLEAETREPPRSEREVSRHAWLRMLYLAAGRRDDALKPIPGIAAAEQDFWTEQLYALATYLDTERQTDAARRSAEAALHLAKATSRLGEASLLVVKNLAFCTEVSGYGVVTKFKEDTFKAGQPLILYAEVDNFKSEESAKGFHTAIRSSYQILDAQGRRVTENDLALTEEHCQNRRRDYFIRYFLSVPDRIYPGKYVLQLTIVDTLSQKIGQSSIDFTVVEK